MYNTSGRVDWLRLAIAFPAALVAAIALGAVYQWALTAAAVRFPILIMIPVGITAIVGVVAVADFGGRLSHVRHTGLSVLCGRSPDHG